MMLQRAVSFGPAARARSQPRRGTFALEPVEALPRLSERVTRLAERALETNPFLLPEFLEPAIQAIGPKGLKLAVFSDRDDLRFFAPVLASGGGLFGGRKLSVWTHPYAPLGAPLIDREMAEPVADSLIGHMRASRRNMLILPDMPLKGPAAQVLRTAAGRHGYSVSAGRQKRPILYPRAGEGLEEFDRMVNQKRRRELDRQLRRLCEMGAVSFMSARTATEIEAAFGMFVTLEGSGWKGQRGTALARRQKVHEFARIAVTQLAQRGYASIDVMRVGDRPIAALVRFDHGGLSVPWKVAFDEEFAAFSPGKQLLCDETRRWLLDESVTRVDPVCEEGNPLIAPLWPAREPYGTLIVSARRLAIGARLRAGLIDLKAAGKRGAKMLLRGTRKRPKPAPRKPVARRSAAAAKAGKRSRSR
jgi:CelD/BcsL family acetyltransferase involved in cellulose biosynthesis